MIRKKIIPFICIFAILLGSITATAAEITSEKAVANAPLLLSEKGVSTELQGVIDKAGDDTLIDVAIWLKENEFVEDAAIALAEIDDSAKSMYPVMTEEEFAAAKMKAFEDTGDAQKDDAKNTEKSAIAAFPEIIEENASLQVGLNKERLAVITNTSEKVMSANTGTANAIAKSCGLEPAVVDGANAVKGSQRGFTFVSGMAPIIVGKFVKADIEKIASMDEVVSIDWFEDIPNIDNLSVALATIGSTYIKDTYGYKGTGVVVGILESSTYPNNGLATNITNPGQTTNSTYQYHSNMVSSIVKGAAPNCTLYASIAPTSSAILSGSELLAKKGCKIINMSAGAKTNGVYAVVSKYLDYIVYTYGLTYVTTSGNECNLNSVVTMPALSYNAIVVGGYNKLSPLSRHENRKSS